MRLLYDMSDVSKAYEQALRCPTTRRASRTRLLWGTSRFLRAHGRLKTSLKALWFATTFSLRQAPSREEQHKIVAELDVQTTRIWTAIDRTMKEIDLLRAYRTRLVADVVTGKLDVRGVETPAMDKAEALEDWDTGEDAKADEMDEMEDVAV